MTYKINKTDGSLLAEIVDSTIDQTSTDLTLIGKNVSGFGEFINENFVKMLENFASTSAPNNPIAGQLWFDTAENRLKVYDGTGFKIGSGPIVSGTAPSNLVQGDFWIDSFENQLYFYDGTDFQLAGPVYKNSQGISGLEIETIYDTSNVARVIAKLWVAETLLGIFSKHTSPFTPKVSIPGFTGTIKPGFNAGTLAGMKFNVTASASDRLTATDLSGAAVLKSADNFVQTSGFNTIATDAAYVAEWLVINNNAPLPAALTIQNNFPLKLGVTGETQIKVDASRFVIESKKSLQDVEVKIVDAGNVAVDALVVRAQDKFVGVFNSTPTATLDVGGNAVASGYVKTGAVLFAALPAPSASLIGARSFITDCTVSTFGTNAAGGGANKVPVWCDGTNWKVG